MTSIGGTSARNTPTSASNNRLTGTGVDYDDRGNLTNWNGAVYEYDDFNQMKRMLSGAEEWIYVYTAGDERVWLKRVGFGLARWTLRDLEGKVLREYTQDTAGWSATSDYLYRGSQLLATETPAGRKHFHLDHLGTPRLITNASGQKVAYHLYYPFGEEATAFSQDAERMKFTGHERDLASAGGAGDDLDYMHARHCSPVTGRFLSVDPKLSMRAAITTPQRWNRYAYGLNNPVKMVDLDGKEALIFIVAASNQNFPQSAFGHAAIYVKSGSKAGGISYGGDPPFFVKDVKGFVESYTKQGHEVKMFVLKTTSQQDQKMLSFVASNPDSGGVDRNAAGAGLMVRQNCTTAVCNTLRAGGLADKKDNPGADLMGLVDSPKALADSLETAS
jgi:RHS repeat-associated protein